jgi:hypothetical protein
LEAYFGYLNNHAEFPGLAAAAGEEMKEPHARHRSGS